MLSIGLVLFPGFQLLNLAVSTVFEFTNVTLGRDAYEVHLLSEHGGPVNASLGFAVESKPFSNDRFDTVIVLGDNVMAEPSASLIDFIRKQSVISRRIGATCTGAFVLARAGLLDGRRATTHWFHASAFRRIFPQVTLEEDRIFVIDGPVCTSAGMTAGVDLALALVESDFDVDTARSVAGKLVMYHRRTGGQSQHSVLLELDARTDRVRDVLAYARQNLTKELSIDELASAASISPRQLSRIFRNETGHSPGKAVERLRVEAARIMIEGGKYPIEVIARETGFGDRKRMHRAFVRAFGQSPQSIQRVRHVPAGHLEDNRQAFQWGMLEPSDCNESESGFDVENEKFYRPARQSEG
jgi:transcriptional regulator GlxA family with amidase domain